MTESQDSFDPIVEARNGYFDRLVRIAGTGLLRTIVRRVVEAEEKDITPFTLEDEENRFVITANPDGLAFVVGLEGAADSIPYEDALTILEQFEAGPS